jgi:hypothetical protein
VITRCRAQTISPRSKRRTARCRRPPTASASGLGAKGGTNAALAVVINANVDALAELGVSRIEIPPPRSACGARSGQPVEEPKQKVAE